MDNLDNAVVCFYAQRGLASDIVRLDTRRAGQSWDDVPSHVAVVLDNYLYEMIAGGFHARAAVPADYIWSVDVALTDFAAAQAGAFALRESPYDWACIGEIAAARIAPDRWLSCDHLKAHHICSCAAAYDILIPGGWAAPDWMTRQYVPISPNDLWTALKPVSEEAPCPTSAPMPFSSA